MSRPLSQRSAHVKSTFPAHVQIVAYSQACTQPLSFYFWRLGVASLIQTLLRIQQRDGWLSDEALRSLSTELDVPLHRLEGLTTFYTHFRRTPPRGARLEICRDLSCELAGGREICERLKSQAASEQEVEIVEVSCSSRGHSSWRLDLSVQAVRNESTL